LLPPGAAATPVGTAAVGEAVASHAPALVDTLLPQGSAPVDPAAAAPGQQVAIPAAPQKAPALPKNLPFGAVAVPTAEGYVAVREKPKVIGEGMNEMELRRLSPEEKQARRFKRNLILGVFCLIVMLVVGLIMAWK
jgi:hypothetical protein